MSHVRPRPKLVARPACARGACALGLTAVLAGGCSFTLVHPAPVRADWPEPVTTHTSQVRCTRSPAPPLLDAGVALTFGTLAYVERDTGGTYFSPVVLSAALPFLASAVYGFWMMDRCRDYQSLFANAAN